MYIIYIYAIGRNMSTQLALNTERINFALLLYILLRLFTTVLEKLYLTKNRSDNYNSQRR